MNILSVTCIICTWIVTLLRCFFGKQRAVDIERGGAVDIERGGAFDIERGGVNKFKQ